MSNKSVSSKLCQAAVKFTNVIDNVLYPKFLRCSLNEWKNKPLLSTVKTVGAVCWASALFTSGCGGVAMVACGTSLLTKAGIDKYTKYAEAKKEGCSVVEAIDRSLKPISPDLMKKLQGRNYDENRLVTRRYQKKDNSNSL